MAGYGMIAGGNIGGVIGAKLIQDPVAEQPEKVVSVHAGAGNVSPEVIASIVTAVMNAQDNGARLQANAERPVLSEEDVVELLDQLLERRLQEAARSDT